MDQMEMYKWTLEHLGEFQISTAYGFLPEERLLEQLPAFYDVWEHTCRDLAKYQATGELQGIVERMPVLPTGQLRTLAEWRRAYVILGFIANAYLWAGTRPHQVIHPVQLQVHC